ncbi:GNAT family N-acetyltransferase [Curtobacterium sp. MCBD17_003]|uniref:GNAT family N-acetyltransferase n=1 Tax=Curtobacterium sp. MCBD17_003 TaxID=2175667 RepID=UPI000DAA9896|nr:GNAT family N-acetyltransferase [Curtobacterium sp. MCBD17_003]WIE55302.1 GNAT family N-acetyltransferase [Curtobacterium sp. MCBD17_003]
MDQSSFDDRYTIRRFAPGLTPEGTADAQTTAFFASVDAGFHQPEVAPDRLGRMVRHVIDDRTELLGVHRRDPMPDSLEVDAPVGTFGSLPKRLSWGDGTEIDTFAIASVTVRPSERRRGVLRRMMTDSLHRAADDGYPLASLTASEGTIYRRFGFGAAIRERTIDVDRSAALPLLVPARGEIAPVDTAVLAQGLARQVYERFHARTPGSMTRNEGTWNALLGRQGDGEPNRAVRAVVHRPSRSEPVDGYVTYKAEQTERHAVRLEIVDLVAATDEAYIALWHHLLAVDLVRVVRYGTARVDDPVLHVLADDRALSTVFEEDHVWFRVLDPVATFASRPFAVDGTVTIGVHDALGFSDGTLRLSVVQGRATVERTAGGQDEADVELDVAELGALVLGAVDVGTLVAAGLVRAEAGSAARLRAMLVPIRTPHQIAYF